ncbi:unnamed protein product [Ceutorhynchus assimilis]|uniref:PBZ-type domain-containing protein n=1 Tax=Ceutorhynchus assimilis TaxID=467358 RepID=A0A9N9MEL1_9CUCU|nr:unnamed protein product [Ceutorhynchus assimilis]
MTLLKIYSLNDTEQLHILASLGVGEHIVGRGGLLRVTDQRVSRKHAVINVSPEIITLTSVHINPCFFKKANDNRLNVIRKDTNHELSDGDTFGLLPTEYWFTVLIQRDKEPQINGKRPNDENCENLELKKAKLSSPNPNEASTSGTNDQSSTINLSEPQTNSNNLPVITNVRSLAPPDIDNQLEPIKTEIKNEDLSTESPQDMKPKIENVIDANVEIKQETPEAEGQEVEVKIEPFDLPTTSAGSASAIPIIPIVTPITPIVTPITPIVIPITAPVRPKREKCWYAATCFRKNPSHREQFSHPGDNDYASDPDEDRPDCPYGASCYRKNPEHRKEYKHSTTKPAPKPNTATAQKRPTTKKNPPQTPEDDDLDDSYDYNDPFINDASSDDYQPSASINSSDTDLEDSQEIDEESQELKRTIREAKKFTKTKK